MNATQATTEKLNVTQEKIPQSQIRLKIEIPGTKSQSIYEDVVKTLSKTVNIPGFRKGKIPRHVLLQRLGKEALKGSALEKLVQTFTEQAIAQESITALGNFELELEFDQLIKEFEPGQDFIFNITVDIPPEIKIGDYSNLQIKAEEVIFDAQKVDSYLEEQRLKEATLVPVEGRPAVMGDVAIIDYQGRFTDVPEGENAKIPGGDATDFEMELADGRFIEEIMEGVIGMNIGDTKEIEVNFSSNYSAPLLAGKQTIFSVTLISLKEKELPALNDDFAQEISDCETMEELRELITTRFKEKAEDQTKTNKEEVLVQELSKLVEAEFPETIIQQEVNQMLTQTAMEMERMGYDIKSMFTESRMAELRELSRPEAIAKLKQSYGLEEVAKRESLIVTDEELETRFTEIKTELKGRSIDEQRLRELIKSDMIKEKSVQWLEEHATIELVAEGSLPSEEQDDLVPIDTENQPLEVEVLGN